jgi:hypothetical protein
MNVPFRTNTFFETVQTDLRGTTMKMQRLLIALTVVNLGLLILLLLSQIGPVSASDVAPVLRGRALEIVDEQGRPRATINVMRESTQANGEKYPETVLLRLITERGRPSVKVSASEQGAGLALVGPSNTNETYVQLRADGTVSSLKLKNEDGREHIVRP